MALFLLKRFMLGTCITAVSPVIMLLLERTEDPEEAIACLKNAIAWVIGFSLVVEGVKYSMALVVRTIYTKMHQISSLLPLPLLQRTQPPLLPVTRRKAQTTLVTAKNPKKNRQKTLRSTTMEEEFVRWIAATPRRRRRAARRYRGFVSHSTLNLPDPGH